MLNYLFSFVYKFNCVSCPNQAECEELQARVETLSSENNNLKDEVQRLSEECEKLTSENSSIKVNINPRLYSTLPFQFSDHYTPNTFLLNFIPYFP